MTDRPRVRRVIPPWAGVGAAVLGWLLSGILAFVLLFLRFLEAPTLLLVLMVVGLLFLAAIILGVLTIVWQKKWGWGLTAICLGLLSLMGWLLGVMIVISGPR